MDLEMEHINTSNLLLKLFSFLFFGFPSSSNMYVTNFLQVKTMHFSHPELDTQRLTITVPVAA